jgi:hypothetical protein
MAVLLLLLLVLQQLQLLVLQLGGSPCVMWKLQSLQICKLEGELSAQRTAVISAGCMCIMCINRWIVVLSL